MTAVLDASLFVAALSPTEKNHARALAAYRACAAGSALLIPAIFPLEVLAALARRGASPAAMKTIEALVRSRRFSEIPVDRALIGRAIVVATAARLRAADAIYATVALDRGVTLLTLDEELATRLRTTYPQAIVGPG